MHLTKCHSDSCRSTWSDNANLVASGKRNFHVQAIEHHFLNPLLKQLVVNTESWLSVLPRRNNAPSLSSSFGTNLQIRSMIWFGLLKCVFLFRLLVYTLWSTALKYFCMTNVVHSRHFSNIAGFVVTFFSNSCVILANAISKAMYWCVLYLIEIE